MGVGGVMALKVTGIATIIEITQKTSAPPQTNFFTGGPDQGLTRAPLGSQAERAPLGG